MREKYILYAHALQTMKRWAEPRNEADLYVQHLKVYV